MALARKYSKENYPIGALVNIEWNYNEFSGTIVDYEDSPNWHGYVCIVECLDPRLKRSYTSGGCYPKNNLYAFSPVYIVRDPFDVLRQRLIELMEQ